MNTKHTPESSNNDRKFINESWQRFKTIPPIRHFLESATTLCGEIEKLPASEQQTRVSIQASNLATQLRVWQKDASTLLAERDRLRKALQRLLRAFEADVEQVPTLEVQVSWETNSQAVAQARAALNEEKKL